QLPALFRYVDVAALVDAQQIGNEIGRNLAEQRSVARPDHVHLLLRNEKSAAPQDWFEPARLIAIHAALEPMTPSRFAGVGVPAGDDSRFAAGDDRIVDDHPGRAHREERMIARPDGLAGGPVERHQTKA